MTLGDRMWVAYWGFLILANLDSLWWLIGGVIVLFIGVAADYETAQQRLKP